MEFGQVGQRHVRPILGMSMCVGPAERELVVPDYGWIGFSVRRMTPQLLALVLTVRRSVHIGGTPLRNSDALPSSQTGLDLEQEET